MTTIATLAAEFNCQPYEVAAALDLGSDYADHAELDEATEAEYREILTAGAQQVAEMTSTAATISIFEDTAAGIYLRRGDEPTVWGLGWQDIATGGASADCHTWLTGQGEPSEEGGYTPRPSGDDLRLVATYSIEGGLEALPHFGAPAYLYLGVKPTPEQVAAAMETMWGTDLADMLRLADAFRLGEDWQAMLDERSVDGARAMYEEAQAPWRSGYVSRLFADAASEAGGAAFAVSVPADDPLGMDWGPTAMGCAAKVARVAQTVRELLAYSDAAEAARRDRGDS